MKRPLVLIACAAVLAGCVTAKVERDSQIMQDPMWEATLDPVGPNNVRGTVMVLPLGGDRRGTASTARVTLSIVNAQPGSSHAWHIHRGLCASDGPIVGPAAGYTRVPIGSDGAGQLIVDMPVVLNRDTPYFVHVHDADAMSIEACGALRQSTARSNSRR